MLNGLQLPVRSISLAILLAIGGELATTTFGQESTAQRNSASPTVTQGAKLKTFDVVSIKPVNEFGSNGYNYAPNGYWAKALPVYSTIEEAYGVYDDYRIIGLPDWAKSVRFDIDAKVDGDSLTEYQGYTKEQRRVMIQALLADRFKLKNHFSTQRLPIYLLKVSGKGPKFSKSDSASIADADGSDCLSKRTARVGYRPLKNCSMSGLAEILTQIIGYQVRDQTGLKEQYDFDLTWSPDTDMNAADHSQGVAPDGPSIFSAIQNELGLTLQLSKGPVTILVIDHIEMPSSN